MILLIDNYDSFSYNLYQLIGEINPDIQVIRNSEKSVSEIEQMKPDVIILSPGPGKPENAGVCEEVVKKLGGKIPILGVCLGHQAICEASGAKVSYAKELMHGKTDRISIDSSSAIFKGLGQEMDAARYHSLIADRETLPECFEIIAEDHKGEIMAVKHKDSVLYGLQFHPESIMTPQGRTIMENFLNM